MDMKKEKGKRKKMLRVKEDSQERKGDHKWTDMKKEEQERKRKMLSIVEGSQERKKEDGVASVGEG